MYILFAQSETLFWLVILFIFIVEFITFLLAECLWEVDPLGHKKYKQFVHSRCINTLFFCYIFFAKYAKP